MKDYVAGFLFNEEKTHVVLIEKKRPEWQNGKLNGIGGKIEGYESQLEAMKREFKEEAGVEIDNWKAFCTLGGSFGRVFFFYACSDKTHLVKSMTDEKVKLYHLNQIPHLNTIENLKWLIPMCLDTQHSYAVASV